MAGIFKRLFKIGESQVHTALDKFEDPIRMTEQGIRDLKKDLQEAMTALAEVKGTAIRLNKEAEENKRQASDYERKAMLLLQKMQKGELDQENAERLAAEALAQKEEYSQRAVSLLQDGAQQEKMAAQLQQKIDKLKATITSYENDLITLKARAKTAASAKKINKQLSKIDSSGTIAMLEKMKAKVEEDEALAQAYGEMAIAEKSIDEEINAALVGTKDTRGVDKLAELKAKMGIN
jgi:phage shock protein A